MNLAGTSNTITAAQVRIGDSGQDGGGTGGSDNNNGGGRRPPPGRRDQRHQRRHHSGRPNQIRRYRHFPGRDRHPDHRWFRRAAPARPNIQVGSADNGTGASVISELQFAGHNVNVQAGNVVLGQMAGGGAKTAAALITFDTGTFSADSIRMGVNSGTDAKCTGTPVRARSPCGGTGV